MATKKKTKTIPYKLYAGRVKIYRQAGTDAVWAKWSLSPGQKKKKITKKVWESKKKPKVSTTKLYSKVISGYEIKWYYKAGKNWYLDKSITTTASYSDTKHDLWTPPKNAESIKVTVKPTAKTYKKSSSGTAPWFSTDSRAKVDKDFDEYPETPSVSSFSITDKTLTATVIVDMEDFDNDEESAVRLQVLKDSKSVVKFGANNYLEKTFPYKNSDGTTVYLPSSGVVNFTQTLSSVGTYQVRAAVAAYDNGYKWSEYSAWSSSVDTRPQAPKLTKVEAIGGDKVKVTWSSVNNITSYKIEYVLDSSDYFNSSMLNSTSVENVTSYIISGLESGHRIYFRIRSVNSTDESSPSNVISVILAIKPSPPTTWSSTTKGSITSDINTTEPLYIYWVHNSSDSSAQQYAKLQFEISGNTYYLTKQNTETDEYGETIDNTTMLDLWTLTVYTNDANTQSAGTIYSIFQSLGAGSIKWKVRTKGAHADYSDWSIERTIEAYEQPNLELSVTDSDGQPLSGDILSSFPLRITGTVTPTSQTPISFHISIISGETYDTTDVYGDDQTVAEGTEIFSKYLDKDTLSYDLTPADVDFASNVKYTLTVVVYTDAGLHASASYEFSPDWTEVGEEPDAIIDYNETYRYATIKPYCNYYIGYEEDTDTADEETVVEYYDPVAYIGTAISGTFDTATTFPSSGIVEAGLGDMYFNKTTFETYTCSLGGDASTATWLYRTTFDFSDSKTWYSGSIINGESEDDTYTSSGIASAVINDFYFNTTTGDIFKCTKSGTPAEAVWQYIWNCFWQVTPDLTLSVYRREQNGRFVTIMEGIDNSLQSTDDGITIRDPHPSFGKCVYRIVATNTTNGAVGYLDMVEDFPETSVVIQWDETWKDATSEEAAVNEEDVFEGSILELPANIKITDTNSNDVDLISYIGRERPVSYYGTQRGEGLNINCEFPKSDTDRLALLRRLMGYQGDVYVREPSGLGYWANITISYNHNYSELTVPVTITVKPVEGGV